MQVISIAGTLGRDAEYKQTQGGNELCSFPVAVNTGWGENKTTTWFDVTSWGKGSQKLADILRKGSRVAVSGELGTREHNGKTYLQVRVNGGVTIQSTPQGDGRNNDTAMAMAGKDYIADDDADSIPF